MLQLGQLSPTGTSNRAAEEDLHLLSYLKIYERKVSISDFEGQSQTQTAFSLVQHVSFSCSTQDKSATNTVHMCLRKNSQATHFNNAVQQEPLRWRPQPTCILADVKNGAQPKAKCCYKIYTDFKLL